MEEALSRDHFPCWSLQKELEQCVHTYISLTNCITRCFKITLTLCRERYATVKDFCVAEATVIFHDPKDLLVKILIARDKIPISNCVKRKSGDAQNVLAHEKLHDIQFDFVEIILFVPHFPCIIHLSSAFSMTLETDFC